MVDRATQATQAHRARAALFAPLGEDDRREIARRMQPTTFQPGQTIFARGDAARGLYVILSGRVRLSIVTDDGRELSFAHAVEGGVFGEIAALDGGARTSNATAITRVEAAWLPQETLSAAIAENARLARAAIDFLCARLRATDHKLEAVALHSIEARLARLLIAAIEARAGADAKGTVTVNLGVSQTEIGLLIGASRPKVNAAVATMEREGAFTRKDAVFTCDVAALRRRAGG